MDLEKFKQALKEFADERDWGQYHNPKNFAVALSVEASEILEFFTWMEGRTSAQEVKENPELYTKVKKEMADVMINLVQLSRLLDVDLEQESWNKLEILKQRYSVDKVKGYRTKIADAG